MFNNFGFVVLNYINYQETVACVKSITALSGDHQIAVVDNNSSNESFSVLQAMFQGEPRIAVVQSGCNGGYSAGNNFGIKVLRERGVTDVIIATSDTRVESVNLLERCVAAKRDGIAVVGPYVRSDDFGSQNPMLERLSLQYIAALHMGIVWSFPKKLVLAIFSRLKFGRRNLSASEACQSDPKTPVDVYMVHGCFLYLSEHYFRYCPLLDEDLFMYGEEDLIAFNCVQRGLRVIYDPSIHVYHGDAKSTCVVSDFRRNAMSVSLATLRRKLGVRKLLRAYIHLG